jgi:hypothetical protein
LARGDKFEAEVQAKETDAQALRSQALSLTAQVEDLTQTNAVAKAEIARLSSILKTLRRGRFWPRVRKRLEPTRPNSRASRSKKWKPA